MYAVIITHEFISFSYVQCFRLPVNANKQSAVQHEKAIVQQANSEGDAKKGKSELFQPPGFACEAVRAVIRDFPVDDLF